MQDVALRAGVSRATVSRIVNDRGAPIAISDATRQRVLEVIEELGYTPNRIAQSLMTNSTQMIGLSMAAFATPPDEIDERHDNYNPTLGKIVGGIQSVTARRSYDVQLLGRCESDDLPPHTNSPLDFVEGVIYVSPNRNYELYIPIIEAGIPLVMIGPNPSDYPVSSVSCDNMGAIYTLTKALLKRDHRRIALVVPRGQADLLSQLREKGYRRAFEEQGFDIDPGLLVPNEAVPCKGSEHRPFAAEATRYLLAREPRPTAFVVAWGDKVLGVLQEIKREGLRCPEDIELVSYGDEQGLDIAEPGVTALDIRLAFMGARAAEMLFDEIEGRAKPGREVLYPPRLRVRGSCRLGDEFEPLEEWAKLETPHDAKKS
jgi:LacI family transcriptional regulator